MAIEQIGFGHIELADLTGLGSKQGGHETVTDTELNTKTYGYKDAAGTLRRFVIKGSKGYFSHLRALNLTAGAAVSDASGNITSTVFSDLLIAHGSDGYVQFNTSDKLNSDIDFFWNNSDKRLVLGDGVATDTFNISATDVTKVMSMSATGSSIWHFSIKDASGSGFQIGDGATITPRLTILKDTYRVGIGSQVLPIETLAIEGAAGDVAALLSLSVSGSTKWIMGVKNTDGDSFQIGDGTVRLNINKTTGYIGNHTAPLAPLDIIGISRFGDSTTNYSSVSATGDWSLVGSANKISKSDGIILIGSNTSVDIGDGTSTNCISLLNSGDILLKGTGNTFSKSDGKINIYSNVSVDIGDSSSTNCISVEDDGAMRFKGTGGKPFGAMGVVGNSTVLDLVSQNNWVRFTLCTSSNSNGGVGAAHATGKLTSGLVGMYRIQATGDFLHESDTGDYPEYHFQIVDSTGAFVVAAQNSGINNDDVERQGVISMHNITLMSAAQEYYLEIQDRSTTSNYNILVTNLNFTIEPVAGDITA